MFGKPHVQRIQNRERLLTCTSGPRRMVAAPKSANPMDNIACFGQPPDSTTMGRDHGCQKSWMDRRGPPGAAHDRGYGIQPRKSRGVVIVLEGYSTSLTPSIVDLGDSKLYLASSY